MSRLKLILLQSVLFFLVFIGFGLSNPSFSETQTDNLIDNPTVDNQLVGTSLPQNWYTDKWGTNSAVFTYPVAGYSGNAVKVQLTSRTSGDAKWYFKEIPVVPSKTYTFSDYYQSNVSSSIVVATITNTGSYVYSTIANPPAAASWTKFSVNFTTSANASQVTVYHLINKVGWLSTDEFSLAPNSVPSPTTTSIPTQTSTPTPTPTPVSGNVILNPSFETVSGSLPQGWSKQKWGTNTTTFSYLNTGHSGTRSAKVQTTKYTSGDAKWQFASVPVTPGDSYQFSDWYKSNIISRVVVDFTLTDNSKYFIGLSDAPASTVWTQYSDTFQVPPNAKSMTVLHLISAVGTLTVDDFSLVKYTPTPLNRPLITLTFDDGWEDNTVTALPLLKSNNIPVTYFFATSFLATTPPTGPVNVSGNQAVMSIYQDGNEIGSHSVSHPDLTTLNSTQLMSEITDSKNYLENLIGQGRVTSFASPYGAYNPTTLNALKTLYRSHRITDEGFNTGDNLYPYRLKVQNILSNTTLDQFKGWVDQAIKDKSWLILTYHRVATSSLDTYDTSLSDFQNQLNYLLSKNVTFKTISGALDEIQGIVPTSTPTNIPTNTPTSTPTNTPTSTPTIIPTNTPTSTPTNTPTIIPTVGPTATPTTSLPIYPTPTSFPSPAPGPNLVPNNSFETANPANTNQPETWLTGNWGTNTAVFSYPVSGVDGVAAAKVELTSYTDGDAKWYFPDVAVEPNQIYTFTNQYQSNISSRIVLKLHHDSGSDTYQELAVNSASTNWTSNSIDTTIPADVHSISVFHLIEQVGFLIVDNYSFRQKQSNIPFSQGMVTLSFDDGWNSIFQNAIPILNAKGFKSTQYITSTFLDNLADGYMSLSSALTMQSQGHEIGAHTKTHPDLNTLTESQIINEVTGSRLDLLNLGFSPVSAIAPPFGNANSAVLQIIKQSGFSTSRTANPQDAGYNYKNTDPFLLKNQSMEITLTLDQAKAMIDSARANKTWLIMVFHQVDSSGSQYSVSPTLLQGIADYLQSTSTPVVTVSQGLNAMLN